MPTRAGRPRPWRASETRAAQSRSSSLKRREPNCVRAAGSLRGRRGAASREGATRAGGPGDAQRTCHLDRDHRPRRHPSISPQRWSIPSRWVGSDSGSPISLSRPSPTGRGWLSCRGLSLLPTSLREALRSSRFTEQTSLFEERKRPSRPTERPLQSGCSTAISCGK